MFKSAQDYDTRGWGYTKRITNYKGDKFDIYVNESGPGGGGDSCAKKRYVGSEGEDKAWY